MRILIAAVLLAPCACASVPSSAPSYTRAPDPPAGLSNVYVYRIGAYPTLRSPMVRIDGDEILSTPEGGYTVVQLPPGEHKFGVDWAWDTQWPDLEFPFQVPSGSPVYLKISGSFEVYGPQYKAGSMVSEVEPSAAEAELSRCCRYMKPKTK